jgi:zinc transport system ATP-binding protein
MMLKAHGALISARDVSLAYGSRIILDHVNVDVRHGEIVTLIGPNGAGKSTLVKVMLGLEQPDSGAIIRQPGLRVGYVPQSFPVTAHVPLSVRRLMTLTVDAEERQLRRALAATEAEHLIDARVVRLSGGEMQRVLLARALLRDPQVLVLDEPVQAVDFYGEVRLYELISRIRKDQGCGILMVSHDLHMVMAESDHVVCLNGHVCCEGGPGAVQRDPEFTRLFGPAAARMIGAYQHHHDHSHDGAPGTCNHPHHKP